MAWERSGDNAATNPAVLAIAKDPQYDDRLMNEAYGFFKRLTAHSAGHTTDGILDLGAVRLMGNGRGEALVQVCVRAGLLTVHRRGKDPLWRVIDDPDFVHIRTKAELDWEKARRHDVANPRLTAPVKRRDGDACRYCGVIVQWRARRGDRQGSYDHRPPGLPAVSPENLVVCCMGCNRRRGGRPLSEADALVPLLPTPSDPFYGPITVAYLAERGIQVTPSDSPATQTAGHRSQHARSDELDTASGTTLSRPGQPDTANSRPGKAEHALAARPASPGTALDATAPRSADSAGPACTDLDGSGREGTGQVRSGAPPPWAVGSVDLPGSPVAGSPGVDPGRRSRGRRGRRGGGEG